MYVLYWRMAHNNYAHVACSLLNPCACACVSISAEISAIIIIWAVRMSTSVQLCVEAMWRCIVAACLLLCATRLASGLGEYSRAVSYEGQVVVRW